MRKIVFLLSLLLALCLSAYAQAATVSDVTLSSDSVGQYEMLEITFNTDAAFVNPFDAYEIDIQAVFTSPSGLEIRYPAFYQRARRDLSQDFTPERDQFDYDYDFDTKRFNFVEADDDNWCVRFSWNEVGAYHFRFEIVLNGEKSVCEGGAFNVTKSADKGIIARSATNPQYLAYRNSGEQFIPIGMNNAQNWDTFGYTRVMKAIAEKGGNFARIWSGTDYGYSSMTIENWTYGPNMYNLDMAEGFDRVTRVAREEGVKLEICFESFSSLCTNESSYGQFKQSSIYNTKNGGYITVPSDFWQNESCRRDYMNRVRYLMARCMWDPNVVLWELFNEINGCDKMEEKSVQMDAADWCSDMREYILSIDPYDRLVGVSFHNGDKLDSWKTLAENCSLDYLQGHHYDAQDVAATMNLIAMKGLKYNGMVLIGEFGSMDLYRMKDPDWEYVHIGVWSGLHTGSACTPMYWFYQELVNSGYHSYLEPLGKYVASFDFVSEPLNESKFSRSDNIRAIGLTNKSGTAAALYVYNARYQWAAADPGEAKDASVTLRGLKADKVTIEVWDTFTGEIIRREEKQVSFLGTVKIEFESLSKDAAVIVRAVD